MQDIINYMKTSIKTKCSNWYPILKRILTWKRITGIVAIISLLVTIWVLLPEKRVNQLKNNIENNIEVIENEFNPQRLLHDNDSSILIKKLSDFQQLALDYCSILSTVNNYMDYTVFSDLEYEEARVNVGVDLMRMKNAKKLSEECIQALNDLIEYEKTLDPDYIAYLSISKKANIIEYRELKAKVSRKYLEKYTELMNKHLYAKSINALNTQDFIGFALKEINKMIKDADFYEYDNAVLDYLLEANKLFKISMRHFVNKEFERREDTF